MSVELVEVLREFQVRAFHVPAGARVWAWRQADGWVVLFNGNDIRVSDGTVGPIGAGASNAEAKPVYSAARLEQYQVAPAKSA